MLSVHVQLASGKGCSLAVSPEPSIHEVKTEAQQRLKRRRLRLAFGGQQLDPSPTLNEVGGSKRTSSCLDLLSHPTDITPRARGAPSLHGAVGQDGSKSIVSCLNLLDAYPWHVLDDGSVVTWGDPYEGGDSSEVQEQLVRVQQIQSTRCAFAAILADGSVVTWGPSRLGVLAARCESSWSRSSRSKQLGVLLLPSCKTVHLRRF